MSLPRIDATPPKVPAAPHAEDQLLVRQLICGDGLAWHSFVNTHGRLVRSRVADVAATFGRSEDESAIDDATAEVFAALLNNDAAALRAFAGRSSLGTYVAVIATRSATRGFARKRIGVPTGAHSDINESTQDTSTRGPVSTVIVAEQQERLHLMLERLPPKQKEIVRMFHLQGKSYTEIADDLAIPMGSIGPTLRRAEAKLREWLEDD